MNNHEIDTHHLLPRSKWWSNDPDNLLRTRVWVHSALHQVFANDTPIEQIKRLIQINSTCLTDWFKDDILNLLRAVDHDYFYKTWIIKNHRKLIF